MKGQGAEKGICRRTGPLGTSLQEDEGIADKRMMRQRSGHHCINRMLERKNRKQMMPGYPSSELTAFLTSSSHLSTISKQLHESMAGFIEKTVGESVYQAIPFPSHFEIGSYGAVLPTVALTVHREKNATMPRNRKSAKVMIHIV